MVRNVWYEREILDVRHSIMKATVRDLRYRTKQLLEAVERGEIVTILYRGKERRA